MNPLQPEHEMIHSVFKVGEHCIEMEKQTPSSVEQLKNKSYIYKSKTQLLW